MITDRRVDYKSMSAQQKAEFRYRVCYDYAVTGDAKVTAKHMHITDRTVLSYWNSLDAEQRQSITDVVRASQKDLMRLDFTDSGTDIDALNRRALVANSASLDKFVGDLVEARLKLGEELVNRCSSEYIHSISDKDLMTMINVICGILPIDNLNHLSTPEPDTLRIMRERVEIEITNKNLQ